MIGKRLLHNSAAFLFLPQYKFKCGLEVHTQLKTKYKLFSLSETSFNAMPNSKISYFDIGIPGTQPKLNPEALLLALKLSAALSSDIQSVSKFDRKHYFYPDQPLGYQITQYFHPLAKGGQLRLSSQFDDVDSDKIINITQVQIEQDTGKLNYDDHNNSLKIDLNRANTPLIELITEPDFENLLQIRSFLKKYQLLVKHLDICTGDLETGAIRVDVNVSVNGGNRVEIKNLGSTGEIQDAIIFEYNRQVELLENDKVVDQETRGWTGTETVKSRSKEDAVDYRYFPDSELPVINLHPNIKEQVQNILPEFPEQIIQKLTVSPFNLELKHAKFLVDKPELLQYYYDVFEKVVTQSGHQSKLVNNWFLHEYLGLFNRLKIPLDLDLVSVQQFSDLLLEIGNGNLTSTSAKSALMEMIESPGLSLGEIIEKHNLAVPRNDEIDIPKICQDIAANNEDVVQKVKRGKAKSINFLVGQAMKQTKGKVNSKIFLQEFEKLFK